MVNGPAISELVEVAKFCSYQPSAHYSLNYRDRPDPKLKHDSSINMLIGGIGACVAAVRLGERSAG